jgi:hypothetical protein
LALSLLTVSAPDCVPERVKESVVSGIAALGGRFPQLREANAAQRQVDVYQYTRGERTEPNRDYAKELRAYRREVLRRAREGREGLLRKRADAATEGACRGAYRVCAEQGGSHQVRWPHDLRSRRLSLRDLRQRPSEALPVVRGPSAVAKACRV